MTKFQLTSDNHLEFNSATIHNTENANVLILAGDICVASELWKPHSKYDDRFMDYFKQVSSEFDKVVYVAGNHEHYGSRYNDTHNILMDICDNFGITFLENDFIEVDNVRIIGATLWTDYENNNPISKMACHGTMNDFRQIRTHDGCSDPEFFYDLHK